MIALFLTLLTLVFLNPVSVSAADITITCDSLSCSRAANFPLFDESNIYPGWISSSKNLTVVNSRTTTCHPYLNVTSSQPSSPADFDSQIQISLTSGSDLLYSGSLDNLMASPNHPLTTIAPGNSGIFSWTASLSQGLDNRYQNAVTTFAISTTIDCLDPVATDNSVSPSSSSTNPNCTDAVPFAPTNLQTRRLGEGRITLMWDHPDSAHTGYLVAFGPSSGNYLYGNPNVGNDDHYTVRELTDGAQYCFYVRTLNGCMPGDRTGEVCVNQGSTTIGTTAPPTGFQSGVLGETTNQEDITQSDLTSGQVAGLEACSFKWLPILWIFILILSSFLLFLPPLPYRFITTGLFLLAFALDTWLINHGCCLLPPSFCRFYPIAYLISYSISQILFSIFSSASPKK